MNTKRVVGLVAILLLCAPLAVPGAVTDLKDFRLQRIDDPLRVELHGPISDPSGEKIRRAVAAAAGEQKQWKVDKEGAERMELSLEVRGKHKARIELKYSPAGYVIRYLESDNLLYDAKAETIHGKEARVIHKIYNARIRDLASRINNALGATARVTVSSEPLRASQ